MSGRAKEMLAKPLQILQDADCEFSGDLKKVSAKIAAFLKDKNVEAEHFLEAQSSLLAEKKEFAGIIFEEKMPGGNLGAYYPKTGSLSLSLKQDRQTQTFAHEAMHAIEDVHGIDSEIKVQAYLRSIKSDPAFFNELWRVLPETIRDDPPKTVGTKTKEASRELGSYVNEGLFEEIANPDQVQDKFIERFNNLTEGKAGAELEKGEKAQNAIALSIYDYNQKKLAKLKEIHPDSPLIGRIEEIQARAKPAYDRAIASPEYKLELEKLSKAKEKAEKRKSFKDKTEDKSAAVAAAADIPHDKGSSSEDEKHKVKESKLDSGGASDDDTTCRKRVSKVGSEEKVNSTFTNSDKSKAKDDISIRDGGISPEVQRANDMRKALQRSSSFSGYSSNVSGISRSRSSRRPFP